MKRNVALWGDFILVTIGTLGLLANEFALQWGRTAVLAFAACSFVGLFGLGRELLGKRSQ